MDTGRMRFFSILLILIAGLPAIGLAQDDQRLTTDETLEDLYREGNHSVITMRKSFEGIKGTPFLINEWHKGSFMLLDSTTYSNVEMKYDIFNEMLVVKDTRSGQLLAPEPTTIQSFRFNNRLFLAYDISEFDENTKIRFWEIIYSGKSIIGRHVNKYLKEADYEGAYSAEKPYDELTESKPIFIYHSLSDEIKVFKNNKKSILKVFPSPKEAEKFIKSEKLNMKKEEDIVQLVSYLDTIN
jgi:hypothetical protein